MIAVQVVGTKLLAVLLIALFFWVAQSFSAQVATGEAGPGKVLAFGAFLVLLFLCFVSLAG